MALVNAASTSAPRDPEQRFSRGSRLLLALALFLVGLSAAQLAYRLAQPTDGWNTLIGPSDEILLDTNVLGAESPLRPGDEILAIAGRPVTQFGADVFAFRNDLPAGWAAGARVPYQVRRAGQTLTLDVPLYRWRAAPLLANAAGLIEVSNLVLAGVAGLAFALRPGNWGARALFFLAACGLATAISGSLTQTFDALLASLLLQLLFTFVSWAVLSFPTFFLLTLCFPRPKRFLARHPRLVLAGLYGAAPLLMLLTGQPGIGWLLVVVWAVLSLAAMAHSAWTVRDPVGRAQVRWAAAGMAVGACGVIANNVISIADANGWIQLPDTLPGFLADLPIVLGIMAPALGLAIAILRYRLFDIDVIIRRTLIYAVLTGLLAVVYWGAILALEGILRPLTGQGQSQSAIVLSTLAIAALIVPLRRRVQAFIDRRFYRRKYDAAQTLAAFAASARAETDLEALRARLASVIDETMQPASVSVWLRPPGK
jgi:hypothetical protein